MERTLLQTCDGLSTLPEDELKERLLITLYPDRTRSIEVGGVRYCVIGDDEGTNIAVNEETKEVYSVDETDTLAPKFINTDVERFLASLHLYLKHCPALGDADDEEAACLVQKMRREFCRLDWKAVTKNTYWDGILEQVEAGLL